MRRSESRTKPFVTTFARSHLFTFTLVAAAAVVASSGAVHAQTLDNLLRPQKYTAHRLSSADPGGGNFDMRRVEPGKTFTLAEIEGPGVITHIWFTYMYPSRSALRKMVLRAYFDDIAEPCVEAPLGDYFGLGNCQVYAYASQPLAVGTYAGLNSYWRMPFTGKARLTLTNDGGQPYQALYFQIDYRKLDTAPKDGLHFFAAYRQAFPCEKGKFYDILETDGGPGHFAGCNLSVEQRDESWWGEGDVRMYIDGAKEPAVAGTGSEDDFSGAWCYSHEFSFPYFGTPMRARFNKKGVLEHCMPGTETQSQWRWPAAWQPGDLWNVYRYHIPDPVPFRKSLYVNIEHGWQGNERGDWYSSVAYWYQAGRPAKRAKLPPVMDRMPYWLRPHDRGEGRWELENFVDTVKASEGPLVEAGMGFWGDMFSGEHGLQWDPTKSGETLTLTFTVPKAGRYKVVARPCKIEAGGTFTLALDDQPPTEPLNLFQPPPFPGPFDVTVADADLAAGTHTLKCTSLEPDAKAKGRRLLIDYFDVLAPAAATQPSTK